MLLLRSLLPSLLNYWDLVQSYWLPMCMTFIKDKSSLVKCPQDFANFLFCSHSVTLSYEGWRWSRDTGASSVVSIIELLCSLEMHFLFPWLTRRPAPTSRFLDHKYEKSSWACTLILETNSTDTCENIYSPKKAEHMQNCTTDARNNLKFLSSDYSVTSYSCLIFSLLPLFSL